MDYTYVCKRIQEYVSLIKTPMDRLHAITKIFKGTTMDQDTMLWTPIHPLNFRHPSMCCQIWGFVLPTHNLDQEFLV